jgi:signal transduction histidine kinase
MISVGYPVISGEQTEAMIFMSSSISSVTKKSAEAAQLIVICLAGAAAVACVAVYFTSKSISRPIRKISEAATIIANGNFEKKIEIGGAMEIKLLAESFNNMAKSLHEQEAHRREFIANISHDIRSPLTSIKGFLTAITDGTVPENMTERYLNIVIDETERLEKLANDILYINKLQSAEPLQISTSTFDIAEMVRKVVISMESKFNAKNLEFIADFSSDKVFVCADGEKILRVLYNLLDNAVKFTPERGIISVGISENPQEVIVSVKDSGIGLSEEERGRVFERFYKADSSRGEHKKGSGLGLSIAREFVRAHNSDIYVKSIVGEGSAFSFSLKKPVDKKFINNS